MDKLYDSIKCCCCEAPAVSLYPSINIPLPKRPYCEKHLHKARLEVLQLIDSL